MKIPHYHYHYDILVRWLAAAAHPNETFFPLPESWPFNSDAIFLASGLIVESPDKYDAMAAIEETCNATDILEEFKRSKARRLYLFSLSSVARKSFARSIMHIDENLLDISIQLPKGAVVGSSQCVSLVVLDKRRKADGKTTISFVDATKLGPEATDFSNARTVKRDFRDILLRNEPILAEYQCMEPLKFNKQGEKHRQLSDLADVFRAPVYSVVKEGVKTVEASPLSPKDFAPYGYTLPVDGEMKTYDMRRIKPKYYLQPSDILLVGQRNIGKACIISPDFRETSWLGASFTYIIRCHKGIDPRAIYTYLISGTAKALLESKASAGVNANMPVLCISALKSLPVPEFTDEEQKEMAAVFEELAAISREISTLQTRATELLQKFFPG